MFSNRRKRRKFIIKGYKHIFRHALNSKSETLTLDKKSVEYLARLYHHSLYLFNNCDDKFILTVLRMLERKGIRALRSDVIEEKIYFDIKGIHV